MYFRHVPEIWQEFPQLAAGVLVVNGIHSEIEIDTSLQPWFQLARERLSGTTESQLPEVQAWRRTYSQMGLKPTKYRSAGEALLRRFRREDDLPRLHPLVDLCNAISLAFALPVAVFDLDQVAEYLEVRRAGGTEQYLAFSGQIEIVPAGEIVFADKDDQVHARRWTFRQSRQSTVSSETRRVLIVSEGMHDSATSDVASLIDDVYEAVSELWSTPDHKLMLTAVAPKLVF